MVCAARHVSACVRRYCDKNLTQLAQHLGTPANAEEVHRRSMAELSALKLSNRRLLSNDTAARRKLQGAVDWRAAGKVANIKSQGGCGALIAVHGARSALREALCPPPPP